MDFQVVWSTETPGERHVSFSGDRTPCRGGLRVVEAQPIYESQLDNVSCHTCGAYVCFDMKAAQAAAVRYVSRAASTAKWQPAEHYDFAGQIADQVAAVAFRLKRERGEWNSNMVFTEFMCSHTLATDKCPEAKLIGMTAITVLETLKEHELG
ncbi:hypothetical protein [Streptomyces lydicus]|uniref:hypothetical protein n=1 Tax=Streptomyces lydicus TaxID=47763 RepID=UPI0036E9A0CC